MYLSIVTKHINISDHVNGFLIHKINEIEKYNNKIINCKLFINRDKHNITTEIFVHTKLHDFFCKDTSTNVEKAFISSLSKMKSQLSKFHSKRLSKRRN